VATGRLTRLAQHALSHTRPRRSRSIITVHVYDGARGRDETNVPVFFEIVMTPPPASKRLPNSSRSSVDCSGVAFSPGGLEQI